MRDVRPGETRLRIADVDDSFFTMIARAGVPVAQMQAALKPVLAKRAELASLERNLQALSEQRDEIGRDQERLRENMKALRGSAEEKQLLQRYTRQLDDQETRLDALKQELTKTTAARNAAREELNALVASVSFEVGGA